MNISVELLMFLAVIFTLLVWAVWFRWSSKRLLKKYDPKKNVGKRGGIDIQKNGREKREESESIDGRTKEDREVGVGESVIPEPTGLAGRDILETASSKLSDKNSKRRRGFFKRR